MHKFCVTIAEEGIYIGDCERKREREEIVLFFFKYLATEKNAESCGDSILIRYVISPSVHKRTCFYLNIANTFSSLLPLICNNISDIFFSKIA